MSKPDESTEHGVTAADERVMPQPALGDLAAKLFENTFRQAEQVGCASAKVHGAKLIDAGIKTKGSLQAGILLGQLCMGCRATISIQSCPFDQFASSNAVFVQADDPLTACLGAQYAGWPIQTEDFFAMGSGPMRMLRQREDALIELGLKERCDCAVGVLESDKYPSESAIALMASDCGVGASQLMLAIAPSTSIAGSIQVVARSIETAMHKLHELKFDVKQVVSATGHAPLPPPAEPGNMVAGIGRTNDAMLYGATVSMWVDCDDEKIDAVLPKIPSESSADYGRPFARIFKDYGYDFYKVDPMLFSPGVVILHNLKSGRTFRAGKLNSDVLKQSFLG